MRVLALVVVLWRCSLDVVSALTLEELTTQVQTMQAAQAVYETKISNLNTVTSQLSRQLVLERLYAEEASRSAGDSGLKQIRMREDGSKPYYVDSHTGDTTAAIHEHADHNDTQGMGEVFAVLNGVEFRTRHNDYKLRRPSTTSGAFDATEVIPYPDVPPAVLAKTDINEQIAEMREWFAAWRDQNYTVRDYRPYFKAQLCYMEGAWLKTATLTEPFVSDRHAFEADSWSELQDQIRFTAATGGKHNAENFAWLPNKVMGFKNGLPVYGQWNYRIMCHTLKDDLPLQQLTPVDNLGDRVSQQKTFDEYSRSRAARFSLNPRNPDSSFRWSNLDRLMAEIPGRDNYMADIRVDPMGRDLEDVFTGETLNTGFYHRWYKFASKDAMGEDVASRGFNDRNLFMAETTQEEVVNVTMLYCKDAKARQNGDCFYVSQRFTCAIPLEIVFTTPLNSWNPYGLEYKGEWNSEAGMTVRAKVNDIKRNGGLTADTAFNGTNNKAYFLTPVEFYSKTNAGDETDTADTNRKSVGVLDPSGVVRKVVAAGMRIMSKYIPAPVNGKVRTRYPVMPAHEEGSAVWKELEPLRDVVMDLQGHLAFLTSPPNFAPAATEPPPPPGSTAAPTTTTPPAPAIITLRTSDSASGDISAHSHTFTLSIADQDRLKSSQTEYVNVDTSSNVGHYHTLRVKYITNKGQYKMVRCDGQVNTQCWDLHDLFLDVDST